MKRGSRRHGSDRGGREARATFRKFEHVARIMQMTVWQVLELTLREGSAMAERVKNLRDTFPAIFTPPAGGSAET
jgi:hypothetical protein